MPNSIQFNEHLFIIGAALALVFIVSGLIQTFRRYGRAPQKHWLAHRQYESSVCAEQQAEQIIRSCWPEEVI